MFGLMLGKLFKPDQSQPPRLLQVQEQADGLQLCFSRLPVAAVLDEKGAFVMLFAVEQAEEQQGRLLLAGGESVSWRLSPRSDGMQLGVVGVQALQGSWSRDADQSSCIRVSLTVRQQP